MHRDLPVVPACTARARSTRPEVRRSRNAGAGREARREAPEIMQSGSIVSRITVVTPCYTQDGSAQEAIRGAAWTSPGRSESSDFGPERASKRASNEP